MAQFLIKDPEIRKVAQGKQNEGNRFLVGKLENLNDPFSANEKTFVCFSTNVVNVYKDLLPVSKGGKAETAQEIPERYQKIWGVWCDYTPANKFYKKHLSNHPEQGIKIGDYVKDKEGNPIIYTTLRVFCRQYIDDEGIKQFAAGESPAEQGARAYAAYCVAIKEDKTPQIANDPNEEIIKISEPVNTTFTENKQPSEPEW